MKPIETAIQIVGGQRRLAYALDLQQPSNVSQWVNGVRKIPVKYIKTIEQLTDGQVTLEELRPDIFAPREKKVFPMESVSVNLSELNMNELRIKYPLLEPEEAFKQLISDRKEMRIEINVNG